MVEDYIQTLQKLESISSNHIVYEINISCPNVKEGGMEFGVSADITRELTSKLRERTEKILLSGFRRCDFLATTLIPARKICFLRKTFISGVKT